MGLLDELGSAISTGAHAIGHGVATLAHDAWETGPIAQAKRQQQRLVLAQKREGIAEQNAGIQREFENHLQLQKDGYVPAQQYGDGTNQPLPGRPTIRTLDTNPDAPQGGPQVTEPQSGRAYTKKPQFDDSNSFVPGGALADAFEQHLNIKKGSRVPFQHVPQLLEALHEAQPEEQVPDPAIKATDQNGDPALVARGKKTGKLSKAELPDGVSLRPPAEKPDASQLVNGYNKPVVFDKATQTMKAIDLPPGVTPALNAVQTEADKDRHVRQQELEETRATRQSDTQQRQDGVYAQQHNKYRGDEENHKAVAQQYWDARGVPPGQPYSEPRIVNGVVTNGPQKVMPADGPQRDRVLKNLETLAKASESKAAEQRQNAAQIRQKRGWGEFAPADKPAAAKPAATPQVKPAAQAAAAPAIKEGTVIVNKKTGERNVLKGGQWVVAR